MSEAGEPKPKAVPKPRSYAHAPRLPEGESVDLRALVASATGLYEIEIGSGRGGFLFERAAAEPAAGLIAFEVKRKWATIVDGRLGRVGLGARARVFSDDAKSALPRLAPSGTVRRVFMHFPDPWWKKRHQKRLVMGDVLLEHTHRLLVAGGEFFVQTDVEERAEQYESTVLDHPGFEPAGDEPGSPRLRENPYGARSPREHRAIADGIPVYRMRFVKRG